MIVMVMVINIAWSSIWLCGYVVGHDSGNDYDVYKCATWGGTELLYLNYILVKAGENSRMESQKKSQLM